MDVFAELNELIPGLDDRLFPDPPVGRNVFVVGAPRSGTTLLTQMVSCAFDIGYINNVAASWWQSPAAGVVYANRLVTERRFAGVSNFGGTSGPAEPHEFGGFWRNKLGYRDMLQQESHDPDWDGLLRSLDQIGQAWEGRSVLFKVFQLVWHLQEIHQRRPETKWIWVQRDLPSNAQSLRKLIELRGETWTSAVPLKAIREFSDASDLERSVAQIVFYCEWLEQQFAAIPSSAVLRVQLSDLAAEPRQQLQRVGDFVEQDLRIEQLEAIAAGTRSASPLDPAFVREIDSICERVKS